MKKRNEEFKKLNQKAQMVEERRKQQMMQRKTDREDVSAERELAPIQHNNRNHHGHRTYSLTAVRQPSSNREGSVSNAQSTLH